MAKKQPAAPKSAPFIEAGEDDEPQEPDSRPLYRMAVATYHDDVYYAEGAKMYFEGTPAWYMKPICAKAKALVKQHFPHGQEQPDGLAMLSNMQPSAVAATNAAVK